MQYTNTKKPIDHIFYISTGRCCSQNCLFCGGSNTSYKAMTGRGKQVFRDSKVVMSEIKDMYSNGGRFFYFEFDPYPQGHKYYIELFRMIKEEKLKIGLNFGAWPLPNTDFVDSFASSVDLDYSGIVISPDSGSEEIRRKNDLSLFQTNEDIENIVSYLKNKNVYTIACFTLGIPGETKKHIRQTVEFIKLIKKYDVNTAVACFKLELGAPLFIDPDRYGVQFYRCTFKDYYEHVKALTFGIPTEHPLGFRTEFLSEQEILHLQFDVYRTCYFRPGYMLSGLKKMKGMSRLNLYAFLAILFNSSGCLQNIQRE